VQGLLDWAAIEQDAEQLSDDAAEAIADALCSGRTSTSRSLRRKESKGACLSWRTDPTARSVGLLLSWMRLADLQRGRLAWTARFWKR
jgi:hypothetical protein